jgi:hypothetical protein
MRVKSMEIDKLKWKDVATKTLREQIYDAIRYYKAADDLHPLLNDLVRMAYAKGYVSGGADVIADHIDGVTYTDDEAAMVKEVMAVTLGG